MVEKERHALEILPTWSSLQARQEGALLFLFHHVSAYLLTALERGLGNQILCVPVLAPLPAQLSTLEQLG